MLVQVVSGSTSSIFSSQIIILTQCMQLGQFLMFLFCVSGVCSVVCDWFWLSVPVQLIAWKDSSPNDLLCVEWDVKPYTLTHSLHKLEISRLCSKFTVSGRLWSIEMGFMLCAVVCIFVGCLPAVVSSAILTANVQSPGWHSDATSSADSLTAQTLCSAVQTCVSDGRLSHLCSGVQRMWYLHVRFLALPGLADVPAVVYTGKLCSCWSCIFTFWTPFYRAACSATHGIAIAILSVCPSVRASDVYITTKLNDAVRVTCSVPRTHTSLVINLSLLLDHDCRTTCLSTYVILNSPYWNASAY